MANEVRFTTTYSFSSDGQTLGDTNTLNYSVTGSGLAVGQTQPVLSGQNAAITFGYCRDIKYLYLANTNPVTGNASISLTSGQTQIITVLHPLESMLFPPVSTGLWASGQFADVYLQVMGNAA